MPDADAEWRVLNAVVLLTNVEKMLHKGEVPEPEQ